MFEIGRITNILNMASLLKKKAWNGHLGIFNSTKGNLIFITESIFSIVQFDEKVEVVGGLGRARMAGLVYVIQCKSM